jgi:hypothetical protein
MASSPFAFFFRFPSPPLPNLSFHAPRRATKVASTSRFRRPAPDRSQKSAGDRKRQLHVSPLNEHTFASHFFAFKWPASLNSSLNGGLPHFCFDVPCQTSLFTLHTTIFYIMHLRFIIVFLRYFIS